MKTPFQSWPALLVVSVAASLLLDVLPGRAADNSQVWTDPEKAQAEDPGFSLQGEYAKAGSGVQVVALGKNRFLFSTLAGGLPGEGWDGAGATAVVLDGTAAKKRLAESRYKKASRSSPTLGAQPPKGAVVLFDGTGTEEWVEGHLDGDHLLSPGTETKRKFHDFTLHLEFRLPYKPYGQLGSQDRGNSGIYFFNRYETQVLDSFGLHYYHIAPEGKTEWKQQFEKDLGFAPQSDRSQWCGAFYKYKTPALNASYPPLRWQTYDITFTAPRFKDGKKTANARFTVLHNGLKIHEDVEVPHGTGAGGSRPEVDREGIYLQGHGNPVQYRNIWVVEND